MAVDLTTIFGSEIKVSVQPRRAEKQYTGFPGAHGLVSMDLGTRGRQMVVTGRLRASGNDYSDARSNLQAKIDDIEEYLWADVSDYTFKGQTYSNVIFDKFELMPNSRGKTFHWTSEGYVTADFVCFLTILI